MRVKIIVNPMAGRGRAVRAVPVICRALEQGGADYDIYVTKGPGDATAAARKAVDEGYEVIAAAGGDGTTNEVANGIAGREAALGVIPCGSGNDMAISLGLPRDVEQACRVLVRGKASRRDLGRVNERYFVNAVGVGFDATAARAASSDLRWLPVRGAPLYVIAVLKTLAEYKACEMVLTVDDKVMTVRPLLVAVGIGKTYAGGMKIVPDAVPDDGLYDVCVVESMGSLETLYHLPKVFTGSHTRMGQTTMMRARYVSIRSSAPVPLHMDGEVFVKESMEFTLIPRGLAAIHP
ncbi:MAG: diacylglycerol kinase family lipid kinase [Firmicutes bacterium]|nr:diacylglycerol kinase family lipid kinase [Bacillota bacterium]MDH7496485.1 diacylglycerol kinase family lipid kinase [Bacillota bacterium]